MSRRIPTNRVETARDGGRALALVREAHGLTRDQLAGAAGWTVARIGEVEEGTAEVEWLGVIELLEAMGAGTDELSVAYAQVRDNDRSSPAEQGTRG